MAHDFKKFPELTKRQMELYYFESPHKQITEDFRAYVVKVTDGDTIRVITEFRDFDFPIRILDMDAPEMNEPGGKETKDWLSQRILNEEVDIIMTSNRVDKYGRLLGKLFYRGMNMAEMMIVLGLAKTFVGRTEGELPNLNKELAVERWL
jgi:endonuclease YncB( thermonuclease family)